MKKLFLFLLPAMVCMLALACSSSEESVNNEQEQEAIVLKYAPKKITLSQKQEESLETTNIFSLNYFKILSEDKEWSEKDLFVSPLGAAFAVGMILNGANGETAAEIAQMYGYDTTENGSVTVEEAVQSINDMAEKLVTELPTLDETTSFSLGNVFSNNRKDKVLPSYSSTVEKCFGASVIENDQSEKRDSIQKVLNEWYAAHPDATELPIQLQILNQKYYVDDFNMYNTIDFKGKWLEPFSEKSTSSKSFTTENNSTVTMDMMSRGRTSFGYNDNDVYQTLRMYFGNGSYSMLIFLPHEDRTVADVISHFIPESWKENIKGLHSAQVKVTIPKFSFGDGIGIDDAFKKLGMNKFFSSEVDLSNMFEDWNGYNYEISDYAKFLQLTEFEVNEKGSMAKALTEREDLIMASEPENVVSFTADHPFVYAIVENSTGAICFMGKFMGVK